MKVTYRQASREDVTRQFRYYLIEQNLPHIALRFRGVVKKTVKALSQQPTMAPPYILRNPELKTLRSWPVAGFEAIRIYFLLDTGSIHIIRVLHAKRDIASTLERERR